MQFAIAYVYGSVCSLRGRTYLLEVHLLTLHGPPVKELLALIAIWESTTNNVKNNNLENEKET